MNQSEQPFVGNGILEAESAEILACDSVLNEWLGTRPLHELLPDLNLAITSSEHTRICPFGAEPAFAKVKISTLLGRKNNWRLLRIELLPTQSDFNQYLDPVTGLPDRRALEPHRANLTGDSEGGQVWHALLFVDLDGFKHVNDQFGHAVGDRVLAIVAERLRNAIRSRDLLVRYGGDEFVALVSGIRSHDEAAPILERLHGVSIEPIVVEGRSLGIRLSIGVAFASSIAEPLEVLISAADRAMYAAKPRS